MTQWAEGRAREIDEEKRTAWRARKMGRGEGEGRPTEESRGDAVWRRRKSLERVLCEERVPQPLEGKRARDYDDTSHRPR